MFKSGDLVWANLGTSYGWWPCEYQDDHGGSALPAASKFENNPDSPYAKDHHDSTDAVKSRNAIALVHFFDDDKFDQFRIYNQADLRPYSCSEKCKLVTDGLDKFSSENKDKSSSLFDFRARQAQFYKDVEMSEVMTDNSPEIANILAQYEVVDEEAEEEKVKPPPKKKRRKRR